MARPFLRLRKLISDNLAYARTCRIMVSCIMKVGIISDTHDRLPLIENAVERLNEKAVGLVLHMGDYISAFAVQRLKPLKAHLVGVFGNNDGDKELLKKRFAELDAEIRGRFAEIEIDGLKIAMLHGEDEELLHSLINTGGYDVIVHGHTHEATIYKQGRTLVINPGEVCGYLSENSTIAILDTETLDAEILQLR
jgi:putative phosphoesterase